MKIVFEGGGYPPPILALSNRPVHPISINIYGHHFHFYKAKITFVGEDYFELLTEFHHKRGETQKEPVKQYIPIDKIKRVSLMRSERLIHL